MKKHIIDLRIVSREVLGERFVLLKCTDPQAELPPMMPGQFAQLRVDGSKETFLRRPISINYVDTRQNQVWFLVQLVGAGSRALGCLQEGDVLNALLPLGNGFSMPVSPQKRHLLVGGGVGTAPLLYLGAQMSLLGMRPAFLLGARSESMLLQLDDFRKVGDVYVTTEDGSMGEKGFVTQHSILSEQHFDRISVCGPSPMMKSVARYARLNSIPCEVSLENMMACGLGACLCCVEKTVRGNVCVCTDGPVFDINELTWE
ncbi:MAG: dihydroorotate dehydrogenase electron transfer subunit [Bacteroidaceae bacterium]|nr:dihydroorotate dehydrogenase electron transfer subunit [Bacteroidaceae bacterium]